PSHRANVDGTLSVLVAAKDASVIRVIYSASSSAYGDQESMPLHEDMSVNPKSPYAVQKYMGELYCRLFSEVYRLSTVSLRYFNVYGPGPPPKAPTRWRRSQRVGQSRRGTHWRAGLLYPPTA